ncbi:MAG: hypothetical protein HYW07_22215 [Candidatus Latescibacteria bacterium]|nr:hypothetical protein [Candidatus Latescibacterota bacterium]
MTQPPNPQSTPPPEQLPWGISYLREDIQDLRQDLRENTQDLRQGLRSLDAKLEARAAALDLKMDGLGTHLNTRIDQVYTRLDAKIDTKFYWTLGTILLTWVSTILAVLFK